MYYNKEIKEIEQSLTSSLDGLTDEAAVEKQKIYGKNELPKKKKDNTLKIFLNEFKNPIILLLLVAIISSFIIGEVIDSIAILFIILVDAIMSTYQEIKANSTAEALDHLVASKSKAIRNGKIITVDTSELTLGDIVILESGDRIGADMRIIESHNLMVDESVLTGESIQVAKNSEIIKKENINITEQTNMLFSGTSIVTGRVKGIVTSIGINTEIGKIADSINNTQKEKSPLTIRVEKLSKQISILFSSIAIIITILLIIKGFPYNEIFLSVIALAVSSMPEGLPLALTMALTIASNKMAKKYVIVRKLNSAESLGSCTVIASDKTGTLTVNEQTAKIILLPNGEEYEITGVGFNSDGKIKGESTEESLEIATLGVINNESKVDKNKTIGDSIDIAFRFLGEKLNVNTDNIHQLEIVPYESENKYSAVFYEKNGETFCTVKGSLEVVKSFCKDINLINDDINSNVLEEQNEKLAKDGYRVIAIANGKIKKQDKYSEKDINNLTFMGLVGFIDPIRTEAIESINECYGAGIKVLMITGDHPLTAYSIAKDLKIVKNYQEVTTGEKIEKELEKGEESFDKFIKEKLVFARVTPLQKLKIVESLKRQGEFVAVTGDGVNDASALKAANIGVAMGSGTDIARETADMIIADDNFKSIVSGIKEGRVAYANIRKVIYFLISCGLAEVIFFCLSILLDLPVPLVAIQLLWLNVVTDGVQDLALSFEKAEENILKEKPRDPKESIFNKSLFQQIIVSGLIIGLFVFIIWYILLNKFNMEVSIARGYIMALMVFIQNVHVFNCRSEEKSAFKVPLKNNWFIVAGISFTIVLQVVVMEIPFMTNILQTSSIPIVHLIYLFGISFVILLVMEVYKFLKNHNKET